MPNHVIRDRVWASRKLAKCSLKAALAYPWIFLVADDWGRFEHDAELLRNQVFPRRSDVSIQDVKDWLFEYEMAGLLVRYHMDGDLAYWTGFEGRPKSKRRPSMFPDPEQFQENPESVRTFAASPSVDKPDPLLPAERSRAEQSGAEIETEHVTGAVSTSNGNWNGNGVPEDQRTEYAKAVWSEFLRVSGQRVTRLMTPGEFNVLKNWMDSGVLLSIVLRAMADTRGKGQSLGYYGPSVGRAIEQWRKAVA